MLGDRAVSQSGRWFYIAYLSGHTVETSLAVQT